MVITATLANKEKKIQLPDTWDELYPFLYKSRSLRHQVCIAIIAMHEELIKTYVALHFIRKTGWIRHLTQHYVQHIVTNMDIRFDNLIPMHISSGFSFFTTRYHMIKPNMENASIREFIFADEYLQAYISGDPDAIYYLTALLCRRDPLTRIRQRHELDQDVRLLKRYVSSILFGRAILAVMATSLLLVLHTKQYIKATYFSILGSGSSSPTKIDFGFHNIVMDIAENGAYGDIEQVYDTALHDIFVFLIKKKQDFDQTQINSSTP